jgi:hypothetical protein
VGPGHPSYSIFERNYTFLDIARKLIKPDVRLPGY